MAERETAKTMVKPIQGEHQDDLAEGEEETVEESIRIHDEKDKGAGSGR
jgi:hypothetical protein